MQTYHQTSGVWEDPQGAIVSSAYSGQPPYVNLPSAENLENLGPIPCGNFVMSSVIEEHPKLGRFVIVLVPDDETRARIAAMGRNPDSFRVHGERLEPPPGFASDGCIVMDYGGRVAAWQNSDHGLQVIQ